MGVDVDDVDWSRVDKLKFALYGGGITLLMDVLLYPLEVIKTRMMIDTKVCHRLVLILYGTCIPLDASHI